MVALKKLNGGASSGCVETDSDNLKWCTSNYIAKYNDLVKDKGSLWVGLLLPINLSRL